tara:strand:- start:13465 stop:14673 length:1209 start_codon:yes stop_codon:yes gene_type:complete
MAKTYRARWIVPVNGKPLENGFLRTDKGKVTELTTSVAAGESVIDLGDIALVPGLVNAHTHLEFSELTQPVGNPEQSFDHWISAVVGYRRSQLQNDSALLKQAIRSGISESQEDGVLALGEITTNGELLPAYQASTACLVSLREVINFSADRIEEVTQDTRDYVLQAQSAGVKAGISPHAPYTVHQKQLTELCRLSRELECVCAMHLAETKEECELITERSGPLREMLNRIGMWDDSAITLNSSLTEYVESLATSWRAIIVHGNYLDRDTIQYIGNAGDRLSVCYCPRTHHYFGHDPYPLEEMLAQGVRVCLGTDSRASNPNLALTGEVALVRTQFPQVDAQELLKMVTMHAAYALGIEQSHGFIGPGAVSDLLAVELEQSVQSLSVELLLTQLPDARLVSL